MKSGLRPNGAALLFPWVRHRRASRMVSPDLLIVGRLRKPHGVWGEIVVEPITDAPAEVFVAGRRFLTGTTDGNLAEDGGTLVATAVRPFREGLVLVLFEGVTGRADAEAL